MSLVSAVGQYLPDFMTEEQYSSQKEHIKELIGQNDGAMTAREVQDETGYLISSVVARLDELYDSGKVYKIEGFRQCTVADHERKVNVYGRFQHWGEQ